VTLYVLQYHKGVARYFEWLVVQVEGLTNIECVVLFGNEAIACGARLNKELVAKLRAENGQEELQSEGIVVEWKLGDDTNITTVCSRHPSDTNGVDISKYMVHIKDKIEASLRDDGVRNKCFLLVV
jgi:hypothetical protein